MATDNGKAPLSAEKIITETKPEMVMHSQSGRSCLFELKNHDSNVGTAHVAPISTTDSVVEYSAQGLKGTLVVDNSGDITSTGDFMNTVSPAPAVTDAIGQAGAKLITVCKAAAFKVAP